MQKVGEDNLQSYPLRVGGCWYPGSFDRGKSENFLSQTIWEKITGETTFSCSVII